MNFQNIYAAAFACLAAFGITATDARAVTIHDIVKEIEENNLGLRGSAAGNRAEVLEMKSENTLPPTSVEYSPFFRSGETGLASSELVVSQEFDFPTKYAMRSRLVDSRTDMLDKELAAERRLIRIEATQNCLDLIYARRKEDILKKRIAMTDTIITLFRKRERYGDATAIDINKLLLTRSDLEREMIENNLEYEKAVSLLTGLNGGKRPEIDSLDYPCPIDEISLPFSSKEYAGNNISVAAAESGIVFAEKGISLAKNDWLPSISLGYRRNTEFDKAANGFLVGLSFPLFSIGKKSKAATARLAAAETAAEDARIQAGLEAEETFLQLATLRAALNTCDTGLAEETLGLYLKSLELRQTTLTDYLLETGILYDRLLTRERLEHSYRRLAASISE